MQVQKAAATPAVLSQLYGPDPACCKTRREVKSKLAPKTMLPFSFLAWRSHLPTLPKQETLRTELHRKVSNPKEKKRRRGNLDL
jgi:hypothetical protein